MRRMLVLILFMLFLWLPVKAQIYVATDGSDTNPGSYEYPYATITNAISVAVPGDTIFIRGGTYPLTSTISIGSSKSGNEDALYYLWAYPGERALLDFSGQSIGAKGISLRASYWFFKGIDVYGSGDNGLQISGGSYNIIEHCSFYENRDTGLQLGGGASSNRIINCDSYYNADPTDYGDADGFAPKLDVGTGNYFYGCRSWGNCDDGWDGYLRDATDITTTMENCWTWNNGYFKDGSDAGPNANGNGFKMGGGDDSNSAMLMHHQILINCVAFGNKNKGFDQNNNAGSMTLYNCTGYDNITANYRIKRELSEGQTLTVRNCISYDGSVELGSFAIEETNSWMDLFNVGSDDFVSLAVESASAPRQSDGSLPCIDFLRLAEGSDLIDGGVDLGFVYDGAAPDLGAFESNYSTASIAHEQNLPDEMHLYQNYPNPFNSGTVINYRLKVAGSVDLSIYNILGQRVRTLASGYQTEGMHSVNWDGRNDTGGMVSSGIYFYELWSGSNRHVRHMVFVE